MIDSTFIQKMMAFRKAYPHEKTMLTLRNDDIPRVPDQLYEDILPIEQHDPLGQGLRRIGSRSNSSGRERALAGSAMPKEPKPIRGTVGPEDKGKEEPKRSKTPDAENARQTIRTVILDRKGQTIRRAELIDAGLDKKLVGKVLQDLVKEGLVTSLGLGQVQGTFTRLRGDASSGWQKASVGTPWPASRGEEAKGLSMRN